jgi:hypothetical protein
MDVVKSTTLKPAGKMQMSETKNPGCINGSPSHPKDRIRLVVRARLRPDSCSRLVSVHSPLPYSSLPFRPSPSECFIAGVRRQGVPAMERVDERRSWLWDSTVHLSRRRIRSGGDFAFKRRPGVDIRTLARLDHLEPRISIFFQFSQKGGHGSFRSK